MDSISSLMNKKNLTVAKATPRTRTEEFVTVSHSVVKSDLDSITLKELIASSYPESEWVVDRLIPEGLTVLSAQPASYKTWLLLDIAICVASGSALLNTFETKQSGVLIVDEENSPRILQQRLKMLGKDDDLPIHFMIEQDFKLDEKKISKVLKFCRQNSIKFLTFDSLVRIHNSSENDAVQMSEVFGKLRRFTKAGINVLITHHNRKGGKTENASQDMRGSSDILAAVDCHLSLKRNSDSKRLIITQTKVRISEELLPVEMTVVTSGDDDLRFEYVGTIQYETKRTKAVLAIKDLLAGDVTLNQKDILSGLIKNGSKLSAKTLRSVLQELEKEGLLNSAPGRGSELLYSLR